MRHRAFAVLAVLMLGTFGARAANAQQQPAYSPPPQQPGNPPQPQQTDADAGVARASFIHGDVSMQRGDSGDASAVTLNTPLVAGDKVSTGDASRTELQLDFANVLRLDERAQANIVALSRSRIQIQLAQGLANYSMLRGSDADVEIDTPNVSVHPQGEGRYRIQVNGEGETEVVVRDGEADVSTPQGSTQVHKGEQITIQGAGDDAQYKVSNAPGNDDWDKWNNDRDHIIRDARSWQHTNPYYTGSQDLDQNGVWSEVPDYGQVWTPTVDAGWAPYRAGRWVWEPYWGWTWVSYESWGWAPYHYGRWFLNGGQWAWWPGPVYGGFRPIWAPAYVSFFGFGGGVGFGLGFGFGSVGWLPIGPGDYFHPWWGGYRDRFNVVDIHNAYNIHEGFAPLHGGDRFSNLRDFDRDDRLRGGISSVSARNFGRGVEGARGVSASDLRGARAMTGGMPITPTRESMRVSDRPVNSQAFSARANQRFFSGRTPAGGAQSGRTQGQGFGGRAAQGQQPAAGFSRFGSDRPPSAQQQGGARGNEQPSGRGQVPGFEGRPSQGQPAAGWNRFGSDRPPSAQQQGGPGAAPRGESNGQQGNSRSNQPSYRPPLDMNKPIVNQNQRSFGGNGGGNRGGYSGGDNSAPSYRNAPSGNQGGGGDRGGNGGGYRSAPAPTYRSAPSGNQGGGGNRGGNGGGESRGGGGGGRGNSGGSDGHGR